MKTDIESRYLLEPVKLESRGEGDAATSTVVGYAAVFNSLSENLGGFREQIAPGAFDAVMDNDVRATFNHDPNHILGRTSSGTLSLSLDAKGLRYELNPPDTQAGRDLLVSMSRGDVKESSFRFVVEDDDWKEDSEGRVIRTINKFSRLIDVSPVTYPAYPEASAAQRGLDQWREERGAPPSEPVCPPELLANAIRIAELEA